MPSEDARRAYQERKHAAMEAAMVSMYGEPHDEIVETEKRDARTQAWDDLFDSLRRVRDLMVEDNGGSHEHDPKDGWLAYMIGRLDELIGHWDPDASPEEIELADQHDRRPPKRKRT
jgi:hypothetical protein